MSVQVSRSWIAPVTIAAFAAILVGVVGGTITDLGPWYQALRKPDWNPPGPAFGIIWTVVFTLTASAAVTAWRQTASSREADTLVWMFALNGFLNLLWSLIFFRLQRPDWAFGELIALWCSIAALILVCGRLSRTAGLLLAPYLVWVTIAGALNWQIVALNGPFR
ncbi:TspO/MBR family protein [Novosphingobium sp. Gsoil 351]|uniref:TspO/MBR family protein n=1 Tax=Novosphingobium sp. Gsoil 351 TaxID=2675225 RepID=UPI001E37805F|nr:TspO/MBR family protein [Novosphingobium sp. Gsoil 351]